MGFRSAALQALALGALAAYLTYAFTGPLGHAWQLKDYVFVLAVAGAVFYNRMTTMKYDTLIQQEYERRKQHATELERVDFVHGQPLQLELNKVTCILFFGSWCGKSRAALKELARLRTAITHGAVQFIGLTQESREELAAYEVKGREASDFQEVETLPFTVAIEDGLMSKEYLVKYDVCTLPQLFIVAKNKSVLWYGDITDKGVEQLIRNAVAAENVKIERLEEESDDNVDEKKISDKKLD